MSKYASGKYALGICDRCGFEYPLLSLRPLVVAGARTNMKVCDGCWEPDHPQLKPLRVVADAEALHDARPDSSLEESRRTVWGWNPVPRVAAKGRLGKVSVQ